MSATTKKYTHGRPIVINGKHYVSIQAAADDLKVPYAWLHQHAQNNPQTHQLEIPNLPLRKACVLNGVHYKSGQAAADEHHISRATLYTRINKYGFNSFQLFQPTQKTRKVTIEGVEYNSIKEAAEAYHQDLPSFYYRLQAYGPNSPEIIQNKLKPRGNPIILCNVQYPNLAEAARQHGIDPGVLRGRLKTRSTNDPTIFTKEPLINVSRSYRKQAHQAAKGGESH